MRISAWWRHVVYGVELLLVVLLGSGAAPAGWVGSGSVGAERFKLMFVF